MNYQLIFFFNLLLQDLDEHEQVDTEDSQPESHETGSQEERLAPSSLVMNLKLEKAQLEDE